MTDKIKCVNYHEVLCRGINCFECNERFFVPTEKDEDKKNVKIINFS